MEKVIEDMIKGQIADIKLHQPSDELNYTFTDKDEAILMRKLNKKTAPKSGQ